MSRRPSTRKRLLCTAAWLAIGVAGPAVALPAGPSFTAGHATVVVLPNQLNITQTTPQTIIDWTSFNISAGQSVNFTQPSAGAIVFNRVSASAPMTIDGALNANGGIWLLSPGGLFFNGNARVNVGSFVGVTGLTNVASNDQFIHPDPNNPSVYTVSIIGSAGPGKEVLTVAPGAQITAGSGFVALQGETVTQNGVVVALDGVSYMVGETGQISYSISSSGQSLQVVKVAPVAGQDRPRLDHGGSTTGLWVGVDTATGALQPGYAGVINLDGVVQATGIKPGTVDGGVVLLVGSDLGSGQPNYNGSSVALNAGGGAITSTHSLVVAADSAVLGAVTAGGLDVSVWNGVSLAKPLGINGAALIRSAAPGSLISLQGAGSLTTGQLTVLGQDVAFSNPVTANGAVSITGRDISLASLSSGAAIAVTGRNVAVGAGSTLSANGTLDVIASGAFTAPASSLLTSVSGARVAVSAGAGGTLTAGRIVGGPVQLSSGGALTLQAPVVASGQVSLQTTAGGALQVNSSVTADLAVVGSAQSILVGPGAVVRADAKGTGAGDVVLTSAGTFNADPGSLLSGGSLSNVSVTAGTAGAGADLTAGPITAKDVTLTAYGKSGGATLSLGGVINASHAASITGNAGQGFVAVKALSTITSAGTINLTSNSSGSLLLGANLTAGGAFTGAAGAITVSPGVTVRSDANGGGGALTLTAATSFNADVSSLLNAGAGSNVSVTAGSSGVGADLIAGQISGRDVLLTAYGKAGGAALTLAGPVNASGAVSVTGNAGQGFAALKVQSPIVSGGSIDLAIAGGPAALGANLTADGAISVSSQALTISPGVVVRSDAKGVGGGDIKLTALGDFSADPTSQLLGGSGSAPATANVAVTAGSASSGGDLAAGQIAGRDVQLTAYGKPGGGTLTLGAPIVAGRNVSITGDPGGVGPGPVQVKIANTITSGGSIDLRSYGGRLAIDANLTADGSVDGSGDDVSVNAGVTVQADAKGAGAGAIQLSALKSFTADVTSRLVGGASATAPTADVSVSVGSAAAGGDLVAGQISGKDVTLTAYGKPGGGLLTLGGPINAGHSVAITGNPGGAGQGPVTLKIGAPVTSAGLIDLRSYGGRLVIDANLTADGDIDGSGDDVSVGPGVTVQADAKGAGAGAIQLSALRSYTADATSRLIGGAGPGALTGDVTITAGTAGLGADLIAGQIMGRDVTLTAYGKTGGGVLTLGGGINAGRQVTITGDPGGLGQGPVRIGIASPVTSGGGIVLRSYGGRLAIDASISADGDIDGSGDDVSVGPGVTVQADAKGAGAGVLQLSALRSFTAAATSRLMGGASISAPTGDVFVTVGSPTQGGDLIAGQISGRNVRLTSYGGPGAGSLTLGGAINASQDVSVAGNPGGLGLGPVTLTVAAPVTSGGAIDLRSVGGALLINAGLSADRAVTGAANAITIGPGVAIRSDAKGVGGGDVQLTAQGDLIADASSLVSGGTAANVVLRAGAGAAGGDLTAGQIAGKDVQLTAQGKAGGGRLTIGGAINAAQSVTATGLQGQGTVAIDVLAPVVSHGTVDFGATGGALSFKADVTADGAVTGLGQDITLTPGVRVRSDAVGLGGRDLALTATRDFTADPSSLASAGAKSNLRITAGSPGAGGDLVAGQLAGQDIQLTAYGRIGGGVLALGGPVSASRSLTATGKAGPGLVTLTVASPVTSGGTIDLATNGALDIKADISAAGALTGAGQTVTLAGGVTVRSDTAGLGGGDLTLTSTGAFSAAASSQLLSGARSDVVVTAGSAGSGADLLAGGIGARDVRLTAYGGAGGAALTLGGPINAGRKVIVTGVGPVALTVQAPVASGGSIDLTTGAALLVSSNLTANGPIAGSAQDITLSPGVVVRSDAQGVGAGDLTLIASRDFTAAASSLLSGGTTANVSVTAGSASSGGDLMAGQIVGRDVALTAYGKSGGGILNVGAAITASRDVAIAGDPGGLGLGPVTVTVAAPVTASRAISLSSAGGSLVVKADLTADGAIDGAAQDISIQPGVTIRADAKGKGAGNLTMTASRDFAADATSLLSGGTTAAVSVTAGSATAGGDLLAGRILGTDVTLTAYGKTGGGQLTLGAAIDASRSVTVSGDPGGLGQGPVTLLVAAPVTSGGPVKLASAGGTLTVGADITADGAIDGAARDIAIQPKVAVRADAKGKGAGDLTFAATRDFAADATSLLSGGTTAAVSVTTGSATAGGDLLAGQIAGKDVTLTAYGKTGGGKLTVGAAIDASRDVSLSGDPAGVGQGPVAITVSAPVTAKGDVAIASPGGSLIVGAAVTADGSVDGSAKDVSIKPAVAIRSDAQGQGAGDLTLTAERDFTADPSSQLLAGAKSSVVVTAGSASSGGDLVAGGVTAKDVTLTAFGKSGGGALTVGAPISAARNVAITGDPGGLGQGPVTLTISSPIVSGGLIDLRSYGGRIVIGADLAADGDLDGSGDDVSVGQGVTVQADAKGTGAGAIQLSALRSFNADASSLLLGGATVAAPTGDVAVTAGSASAGADLLAGRIVGRDVSLTAYGKSGGGLLTLAGATTAARSVSVTGDPGGLGQGPVTIRVASPVASGGSIQLDSQGGVLAVDADLVADGAIDGSARDLTIAAKVTVQSAAKGGSGGIQLTALKSYDADASSLLLGGASLAAPGADVSVAAGSTGAGSSLRSGRIAGRDVSLSAYGPGALTVASAVFGARSVSVVGDPGGVGAGPMTVSITAPITSAGPIQLASNGGTLNVLADVISEGAVSGLGRDVQLGAGVTVQSDARGASRGDLQLTATASFTADPTSRVLGGALSSPTTADVAITSGGPGAGGSLAAGVVSGRDVNLTAYGLSGGGALTLAGAVNASHGLKVMGNAGGSGQGPVNIRVLANLTSSGELQVRGQGGGDVSFGAGTTTSAGGYVYLGSSGNLVVSGQVSGQALAAAASGTLTIGSGASLSTTGSSAAPTWPVAPRNLILPAANDPSTPAMTGLTLAAGALDLQGSIAAGAAGDVYVLPLGAPGTAVIGGSGGGGGFQLTSAQIGRIRARNLIFQGGQGEGLGGGMDLRLEDLAIDPSRISSLWIGTSSDRTIQVTGAVSGGGGASLNIGYVLARGGSLDGYIPSAIEVSGSLGSGGRFAAVGMIARGDILIGSSGFISAAKADANFDALANSRSSPSPGNNAVLVSANVLQVSAMGRVIQQNTAFSSLSFAGLAIDAPSSARPMVSSPLSGQAIGGGWTFNGGPTRIDVFGSVALADGTQLADARASSVANLTGSGVASASGYRFNGCAFATVCSGNGPAPVVLPQVITPPPAPPPAAPDVGSSGGGAGGGDVGGGGGGDAGGGDSGGGDQGLSGGNSVFTMFSTPGRGGGGEFDEPITASGNNDLWTGPRRDEPR